MRPPFSRCWETLVFSLCVLSVVSWGADNKPEVSKPETLSTSAKTQPTIELTLMPSRQQAVAGSDFGITVRIENTSDRTIYFLPKSFLMVVPPELAREGIAIWPATFPIPPNPKLDPTNISWSQYSQELVTLPPGSNTSAIFSMSLYDTGLLAPVTHWIKNFSHGLSFAPGKYTLTVVGQYWDTPVTDPSSWQTQSKDIQEDITAPQTTIIFGAILGGVFAFLLVWRDADILSANTHWGWGLVSAILLSIIVTILLSRLTESQFIVRVTVSDLWGAMAVGFIGAASGPSILQKFINLFRRTPPQPEQEEVKEKEPTATEAHGPEPAALVTELNTDPEAMKAGGNGRR